MAELLLVDDDPDLALIVNLLGKRAGHAVARCADVPSAWEWLQHHRADLLLLDVNLPGPSGLELCRRLCGDSLEAGRVPVALFVQPGITRDVAAGWDAGADFLVSKDLVARPLDWQGRIDEVLAWLRARARGQGGGELVGWSGGGAPRHPPEDWAIRLNRALSEPAVRRLGTEVLQVVLRRALRQAGWEAEGAASPPFEWADLEGAFLSPGPQRVGGLLISVAEQMERLLGTKASASFRSRVGGGTSNLAGE